MPLGFLNNKNASRSSQYLEDTIAQARFEDSASPSPSPQSTPINSAFPQEVHARRNTYSPQTYDNRLSTTSADLPSHATSGRLPASPTYLDNGRASVSGDFDNCSQQDLFETIDTNQNQSSPIKKKSTIFDRISSKVKEVKASHGEAQSSSHGGIGGIGRRISKRNRDSRDSRSLHRRPSFDATLEADEGAELPWRPRQASVTSSPIRVRPDDSEFDPYLIRERPDSHHQDSVQKGMVPQQQSSIQQQQQQQQQLQQQRQRQPSISGQPAGISHLQAFGGDTRPLQQQSQSQAPNRLFEADLRRADAAELHGIQLPPGSAITTDAQYPQPIQSQVIQAQQQTNTSELEAMQRPEMQRPGISARGQSFQGSIREGVMPYPNPAQPRRVIGNKAELQGESREPPPQFLQKHPTQNVSTPSVGQIPPSIASSQGSTVTSRGPLHQPQVPKGAEQERETPPPVPVERDISDQYKELSQKYKKVKSLYFEKTAQVEALQNTIANQRLSVSRTSLDDNEYTSRFNRLDGAVKELAFSIRKSWRSIPAFFAPFVNQDAVKVGTKEMTAVGRAHISHFLANEIFHATFHPGLDPELSSSLKIIEDTLRISVPPNCTKEEEETHTSKIVQWRLTTLEGLTNHLSTAEAHEHVVHFTQICATRLTASLLKYLHEPDGTIESSATMIVELAVSIAINLPLESRDILISYPKPADPITPNHRIEPALPPLENPGRAPSPESQAHPHVYSHDSPAHSAPERQDSDANASAKEMRKEKTRSGVFAGLMGVKKGSVSEEKPVAPGVVKEILGRGEGEKRVRYAAFLGVEVRGRSVLVKAPVWTIA